MNVQETGSNISFGFFIHSDEAGDQMYKEYEEINGPAETTQRLALIDAKFARSQLVNRIFGLALDVLLYSYMPYFSLKAMVVAIMAYDITSGIHAVTRLYDSYVKLQPNYQKVQLGVA